MAKKPKKPIQGTYGKGGLKISTLGAKKGGKKK